MKAANPLSQQQRAVWAAQQLYQHSDLYNVPRAYRLTGPVDASALEGAVRRVMERHPALCVDIDEAQDGTLHQSLGTVPARVLAVHDIPADSLRERLAGEISRPFGPESTARLRAHLFRLSPENSVLLLVFDHVAVDAPSVPIVLEDLAEAYSATAGGAPVQQTPARTDYFDYARWQEEHFASPDGARGAAFWGDYLKGWHGDVLHAPEAPATGPDALHMASVPVAVPAGLLTTSERLGFTPFAVLLAAFAVALQHFSRADDVLITYPAIDWKRSEYDRVVGLFTELLAFRCPEQRDLGLRDYVAAVQDSLFESFDHQSAPLDRLWDQVRKATHPHSGVDLPAMLSLNDATAERLPLPGIEVTEIPTAVRDGKANLMLSVEIRGTQVTGLLEFRKRLYEPATARRIAAACEEILRAIVTGWDGAVRAVPLASAADRALVLDSWNPVPPDERAALVPECFTQQARTAPDSVAVLENGQAYSYRELDLMSRDIASRIAALALPPGSVVALCLPRSVRFVASVLAVLRSGHAFLPVDGEQPARRRAFLLSDSGAAAAVVHGATDRGIPEGIPLVHLEQAAEDVPHRPFEDVPLSGSAPAYLIATSGTTGLPKTVVVPHRALANHLAWKRQEFGWRADDRFYFKTPGIFDASVWEYLAPLTAGALTVIAPEGAHRDPALLLSEMRRYGVTVVQFVPTLLKAVLAEGTLSDCTALHRLFSGGEPLERPVVDAVRRACRAEVVNLYGPTEATIDATFHRCSAEDRTGTATVPIGRPVHGAQAYVLGPGGQPLPPGFVGELHLGGLPLALGYINRAELTAERFIPHPFSQDPSARLYRTGDLAAFREDGVLEFRGRDDAQVKVRGLRVELDGLRHLIMAYPEVSDAVVTVRPEAPDSLLAYCVVADGVDLDGLRRHLTERLPSELVPDHLIGLPELPVTPTGKVDARALPTPEAGRSTTAEGAPRGDLERRLTDLWATALSIDSTRIPRDSSLFELGGNSLTLIRLHRLIRQEFRADVAVTDLFTYPTVAAVARLLNGTEGETEHAD
ncbi:amino acid adenylation domain-containing protein [Streptomyces sp. NPDC039022]|uniref:non-ribosomal peptide synthetase n=1 Tax=Streptomyces sp. NPDC039022 TaxID=3157091 RepID=UPI0033E3BD42